MGGVFNVFGDCEVVGCFLLGVLVIWFGDYLVLGWFEVNCVGLRGWDLDGIIVVIGFGDWDYFVGDGCFGFFGGVVGVVS